VTGTGSASSLTVLEDLPDSP